MTSPVVIQQPGFGEQIQQGLAPLMRALQVQQQQAAQQQQLALQQQQEERLSLAQRTQARNQAQGQFLELMKAIGPTVLDDPQVQEQITQAGLTPQGIKKAYDQQQKSATEQQQAMLDAALQGVPDNLRKIVTSASQLAPVLGKEGASMFMREAIDRLGVAKPEEIAQLKARFPDFFAAGVPESEAVTAAVEASIGIAQAKQGLGPGAEAALRRQLLQLRSDILRQQLALKDKDPDKRLQAALALQRQIQPVVSDIIQMGILGLTGKSMSERVEAIWGPEVRRIYDSLPQTISKAGGLAPEAQ